MTNHGQQATMHYLPALDGLRAAAVLAVMAYHGGVVQTPGGFLGVDLFFVLSGFLITSLLVIEHGRTGRVDLKAFWMRRARRLLPALFLVLSWVALYAAFWADPAQRSSLRKDSLSTLFYVANWRFVFGKQSYFEQFMTPSPLRHMWSLGIEEQWYLLWPLMFVGIAAFIGLRRRSLPWFVLGAAGASAVLMAALERGAVDPSRAYYGTDARVQGLLLGAAAAIFVQRRQRKWSGRARGTCTALAGAGALLLVVMVVVVDDTDRWMYRGGFLLAASASLLLVVGAWLPGPTTALQRLLSIRPLVAVGLISYGLYLWHWPVYVFMTPARTGLEGDRLLLARFAVTFVVAIASYHLVERPIRSGSLGSRRLDLMGGAVALSAMLLAFVVATEPLARIDASAVSASGDATTGVVGSSAGPGDFKIYLAGDSTALTLGLRSGDVVADDVSRLTEGELGCSISSPTDAVPETGPQKEVCAQQFERWEQVVADFDPDVVVLMFGTWETADLHRGDTVLKVGTRAFNTAKSDALETAISILSQQGAHVVVLTSPCFPTPADNRYPAQSRREPSGIDNFNDIIRDVVTPSNPNASVADLHGLLCPSGTYGGELDGVPYTDDGTHLNPSGARAVWRWLAPQLEAHRTRSGA